MADFQPAPLAIAANGNKLCPCCKGELHFVDGGAVRVVNGQADMDNIKAKYECYTCGVFFKEILTTGFYDIFPLENAGLSDKGLKEQHTIVPVGELKPMQLHKNGNGKARCPRCGEMMDFVEGQAVHIVDGKADMENVWDHFYCQECHSIYRRIVNTDYFQYAEK